MEPETKTSQEVLLPIEKKVEPKHTYVYLSSTLVTILAAVCAVSCVMAAFKVIPVVTHVTTVITRANVVFRLFYDYMCIKTQMLTVEDCALLRLA